eukprot:Plantae.Rhodophyta-Palmaria_palmata.ctg10217.p1 GENE.Plantae.Rhodophyta-Palmaria_palmata.ctg10217~~Plantae.Rhodophyta-Palmaria_palmata.ctg10217.p1  ORF type:complete len:201 (+),score=34.70 Plantae.Rhodophyta-Palmaria_palmata.ctg10217:89-604(+)
MQAVEIMMAIYGGEVGNAGLKYLPFEGMYIAGGIAPKNIEFIRGSGSKFMERFAGKGRMTSIMSSIPVYVVMQEDLGLRGAHVVAARLASVGMAGGNTKEISGETISGKVGAFSSAQGSLSIQRAMRSVVTDYPLVCAALMSMTAGVTAAAVAVAMVSSKVVARSLHGQKP